MITSAGITHHLPVSRSARALLLIECCCRCRRHELRGGIVTDVPTKPDWFRVVVGISVPKFHRSLPYIAPRFIARFPLTRMVRKAHTSCPSRVVRGAMQPSAWRRAETAGRTTLPLAMLGPPCADAGLFGSSPFSPHQLSGRASNRVDLIVPHSHRQHRAPIVIVRFAHARRRSLVFHSRPLFGVVAWIFAAVRPYMTPLCRAASTR